MGATLQPSDEHWHASTKHAHWNESFYFNAFDSGGGWACAARVGVSPNAGKQDGFICLYLPDQTTGFVRTVQAPDPDGSRIVADAIEFRCIEPFRHWQIRYEGPIHHYTRPARTDDILRTVDDSAPTKHLELDLDLRALSGVVDYDDRSVRVRPLGELLRFGPRKSPIRSVRRALHAIGMLPIMMGAHHYEQSMAVRGTITVDREHSSIAGSGQRDHSWGVRDMRVPASWRWVSCQFGDALCFNATQVDVLAMRVQSGFIHAGGETEALARWGYHPARDPGAYWPDSMNLWLETKSGRRVALEAEIITPLPVIADPDARDVLVTAARAEYRWEGRTAHGMVELMERLS